MLPQETNKVILQRNSDLQDAFKKLREKSYTWAFFVVTTERYIITNASKQSSEADTIDINEHTISPGEEFSVHLDDQFEWLDFGEANEPVMPNGDVTIPYVR